MLPILCSSVRVKKIYHINLGRERKRKWTEEKIIKGLEKKKKLEKMKEKEAEEEEIEKEKKIEKGESGYSLIIGCCVKKG